MSKSSVNMPKDIKKKCHKVIHVASVSASAAGAVPIPLADTIPITGAQVAMVVSLGKIFGVTISKSVAKAVVACSLAQNVGRTLASAITKSIPVVNVTIAPIVNSVVAGSLTELLGWGIADDFYRLSIGDEPENLLDEATKLKKLFNIKSNLQKSRSNSSKTKSSSAKSSSLNRKTK